MENVPLITSGRYPSLEVEVVIREYRNRVWAYIDTGFDGYLAVPTLVSRDIGAADYVLRWGLADGSSVETREYLGSVDVVGTGLTVLARITSWVARLSWGAASWIVYG